jgi:hypothetical protein
MSGNTPTSWFCTMGDMSQKSVRQRKLGEPSNHHWDVMPVIISHDDDKHGDGENDEMHKHHDDDNMNNEADQDQHSHGHAHSMPNMSQGTIMYMDGFHSALFHRQCHPHHPVSTFSFRHGLSTRLLDLYLP